MKKISILFIVVTLLEASYFSKFYNKGEKNFDKGRLDKAYLDYSAAYNYAQTDREKVVSLGALAEVSRRKGYSVLAKEYAIKILSLDPSNKFAKKVLESPSISSPSLSSPSISITPDPKLTKKTIVKLICKHPRGENCSCEDIKFVKPSDFIPLYDDVSIEQIIQGRFLKKHEAVVSLRGCEPQSQNWGSYLLLKKGKKGWKTIRYGKPYLGDDCKKIELKNGKEGLVCQGDFMNQGYFSTALMFYTFDKAGKLKGKILYRGEDNAGVYGGDSPKFKNTTIKNWKVVKKGNKNYAIIEVFDENAKHSKIKTIKKEIR